MLRANSGMPKLAQFQGLSGLCAVGVSEGTEFFVRGCVLKIAVLHACTNSPFTPLS